MRGTIYMKDGDGLREMTKEPYEYESILQEALAEYPRLLAGDQMADTESPRWMLVAREASVPDSRGGGERWSADHLFVDQEGIPTIIEVKRGENTEVRREIVGQMLDYISHATLHWEADTLRDQFVETCEDRGIDPDERLAELLQEEDPGGFWQAVETNLRSKQVRLLFAADEIPSELKRVVEFLNESMGQVDVYALEISQYVSDATEAYVPRLYGQTEEAKAASSASSPSRTGDEYVGSEQELYEDLEQKLANEEISQQEYEVFLDLYEFAKDIGDGIDIGGAKNANFGLQVEAHQGDYDGSPNVFTANVEAKLKIWPAKSPIVRDEPLPVEWDPTAYERYKSEFQSLDMPVDENDVYFEDFVAGDQIDQFKEMVGEFVAHCREAEGV